MRQNQANKQANKNDDTGRCTWHWTLPTWIVSRSGIHQRHFAAENETTSDLAIQAANHALAAAGMVADDLDAIIVATSTSDLTFPSAATMVQNGLGMTRGFAYDVQAVCAGFVFALATANAQIVSGQAKRVMVIGAETFSRIMDWEDRTTCVLFGDGAGALILEAQDGTGDKSDRGILSVDLNSDGRGKEVFRHAVEKLAATAQTAMDRAKITSDEVDWVVPHQANIRIIQGTAKKMGVPDERVVKTVQNHGNTSAASIPLALSVAVSEGKIQPGQVVVTEAIGGGLAWGAVVLRW